MNAKVPSKVIELDGANGVTPEKVTQVDNVKKSNSKGSAIELLHDESVENDNSDDDEESNVFENTDDEDEAFCKAMPSPERKESPSPERDELSTPPMRRTRSNRGVSK